ncbi:MAG: A/G-specific adenine glycosylase [Deltaproteobacteria bacterium]|nr:A/G-specific adenine glycosylase [Deltaproteobacteria bacterium]
MKNRWGLQLVQWYLKNQRPLPWRKNQDPYKILVSEIMLQQTQVIKVIPYFERFVSAFPNFESLAKTSEEDVLKLWSGLGYYRRARNLKKASSIIVQKHGGKMPENFEDILNLPGIGDYTASAISSIALEKPFIVFDGNVLRITSRIFGIATDLDKKETQISIKECLKKQLGNEKPSIFNQALMELGALICTPSSPLCLLCPVQNYCYAFENNKTEELPPPKKKQTTEIQHKVAAVISQENKWLLTQKKQSKILEDLWIFPEIHKEQKESFKKNHGLELTLGKKIGFVEHHITYRRMKYEIRQGFLKNTVAHNLNLQWFSKRDLEELPHSSLTAKIMNLVQGR